MILLAADTSGKQGSIALAKCGPGNECQILEVVALSGGAFSAQLVPQIAELLAKRGFIKHDIGGFAVATGPGSFTGLRVGLAAIKALAEALAKPIAAISLLNAVAVAAGMNAKIFAALDAGRGEIYLAEYEAGKPTDFGERLLTREDFFAQARSPGSGSVATPDEWIAEAARDAGIEAVIVKRPDSAEIAILGWKALHTGLMVLPEELDANYVRRSDAEIFAKPGFKS
jgi:tRNA threonylcarbamoyladenosine biosynthesis protein TsaB